MDQQIGYQPCLRCGRWFQPNVFVNDSLHVNSDGQNADGHNNNTTTTRVVPPVPLTCLESNPAFVRVWNKMNHDAALAGGSGGWGRGENSNVTTTTTTTGGAAAAAASRYDSGGGSVCSILNAQSNWEVYDCLDKKRHEEEERILKEMQEAYSNRANSSTTNSTSTGTKSTTADSSVILLGSGNTTATATTASTSNSNGRTGTDEDHVGFLFCHKTDCRYAPFETDTSCAVWGMQYWEHSVACADCGRVWPVPVLHPSSYSTETRFTTLPSMAVGDGSNVSRTRVRFLCCDYPEEWGRAAIERQRLMLNEASKKNKKKGNTKAASASSMDTAANSKNMCPSVARMLQQQQQAEREGDNNGLSSTQPLPGKSPLLPLPGERLSIKPVFAHGVQARAAVDGPSASSPSSLLSTIDSLEFVMAPQEKQQQQQQQKRRGGTDAIHTLSIDNSFGVVETIRDCKILHKELDAITKKRLELAVSGEDVNLEQTPVLDRAQRRQEEQQQKKKNAFNDDDDDDPFSASSSSSTAVVGTSSNPSTTQATTTTALSSSRETRRPTVSKLNEHLSRSSRQYSAVFARAGFVGVADPALYRCLPPGWLDSQHSSSMTSQQQQQQGERQGGKQLAPITAQEDKNKPAGKRRPREQDDKPAAKTAAKKASSEQHAARAGPFIPDDSDTDASVEWSGCDECDKWRILPQINGNPYKGKEFKCSMLGDGTTCKTRKEEHDDDIKVKQVRRVRIQALRRKKKF